MCEFFWINMPRTEKHYMKQLNSLMQTNNSFKVKWKHCQDITAKWKVFVFIKGSENRLGAVIVNDQMHCWVRLCVRAEYRWVCRCCKWHYRQHNLNWNIAIVMICLSLRTCNSFSTSISFIYEAVCLWSLPFLCPQSLFMPLKSKKYRLELYKETVTFYANVLLSSVALNELF